MERRRNKRENQLHFFEECGFRIGESGRFSPAHGGARVEKVDAQVRVISFDALADVLDGRDVEWDWNAVDG